MADIISQLKEKALDIAKKIGLVKDTGAKQPSADPASPASPAGSGGAKPKDAKPEGPKFDLNLYIKATQNFWEQFFTVSLPAFFQDLGGHLKKYPDWFKGLDQGEQIAHVVVYTGVLTIIIGTVLAFVL